MPGTPPSIENERDGLVAYLKQQREGLKNAAYGLTEEQIRLAPTKSTLTIGGLIKHAATTERGWIRTMLGDTGTATASAYLDSFSLAEDETLESVVAALDEVSTETEAAIAGLDDLGRKVQLPDAPWYAKSAEGFSARWILLHMVEELARHAGHADIIREQIDGATMYELMAAAEGWPATDWLQPWQPATASA